jgi:hypothetical protein
VVPKYATTRSGRRSATIPITRKNAEAPAIRTSAVADVPTSPSLHAAQRIAAQLRPRAHHLTTDRTPAAVLPPDPPAAGPGRRTSPPAAVSCSRLLGGGPEDTVASNREEMTWQHVHPTGRATTSA